MDGHEGEVLQSAEMLGLADYGSAFGSRFRLEGVESGILKVGVRSGLRGFIRVAFWIPEAKN